MIEGAAIVEKRAGDEKKKKKSNFGPPLEAHALSKLPRESFLW